MSYRQLPNNNPAVQTMHPQSQQLVQGAEGVMLPQIMGKKTLHPNPPPPPT